MKNKIILLAALAAVSCAKAPQTETEKSIYDSLPANAKEFSASNSIGDVRSHLQYPDNELGNLCWDNDDVLGIYAFNTDDMTFVSSNAYIAPNSGDGWGPGNFSAHFKSTLTDEEWFAGVGDGVQKRFYAYYPTNGIPIKMKPHTEEQKSLLPFDVDNSQSGDYSRHQIMFAYAGLHSKGENISFAFTPITALLRFHFKSLDQQEYQIGQLYMSMGMQVTTTTNPDVENYIGEGKKILTGRLVVDLDQTAAAGHPVLIDRENGDNRLSMDLRSTGDILTVNGSDWSSPVFGVVIPTPNPEPNMILAISAIKFDPSNWDIEDAFTKGGSGVNYGEAMRTFVTLPSNMGNGFEAGKLYDFYMTLNEGRMDVGRIDSFELGTYNITTW